MSARARSPVPARSPAPVTRAASVNLSKKEKKQRIIETASHKSWDDVASFDAEAPTMATLKSTPLKPQISFGTMEEVEQAHMICVHGLVGAGLCCAAWGANMHLNGGPLRGGDEMLFVQIACVFLLGIGEVSASGVKGISAWRAVVFFVCCFAAGLNAGTWVWNAAQVAGLCKGNGSEMFRSFDILSLMHNNVHNCPAFDEMLYSAFVLTALCYACFFLTAILAPPGRAQYLAPLVTCGIFILSGTYWLSRIFGFMGSDGFDVMYVQMGLVIYCVKVYVDTEEIYERVRKGDRDVISHSLKIFFNFLQIFIRIITILAKIAAEKDKKEKKKND
jgi:FtsH-binding integral membrane protein